MLENTQAITKETGKHLLLTTTMTQADNSNVFFVTLNLEILRILIKNLNLKKISIRKRLDHYEQILVIW